MLVWTAVCVFLTGPQWVGPSRADAPTPQRIVSLAPSATEFICALQACDHLVGVTRFDDFPPEVRTLPKVGGFVDPSVEAIVGLRPDLVVAVPTSSGRRTVDTLARLGLTVLVLPTETLDDVWEALATLGKALRREAAASREAARLHNALAPAAPPPDAKTAVALLVVGHKPLVVAGRGTFLDTLLTLAGGRNAVLRGPPYPVLDLEALVRLDPDVIIDLSAPHEGDAFWQAAPFLRAVKQGRIVALSDPALVRPGPRLDEGLRHLRAALAEKAKP